MIKLFSRSVYICTIFLMLMALVSCGGSGSDPVGSNDGGGSGTPVGSTGTFSLSLTDAPASYDYEHVFVTIVEVQVKQRLDNEKSGWITVSTPEETFDLLALQNGTLAPLALAELEAGRYNQIRLILTEKKPASHPYANYLIIKGDPDPVKLRALPSQLKNGIKIVQGFTIEVSGSTELILDFDANRSVVQAHGKKGWHLKPTIRVLETRKYSVSGVVEDEVTTRVNGASVSSQVFDPDAIDPKDEITITAGTISASVDVNEDGNIVDGYYFMYLPITYDSFNIVATMDGFLPECRVLDATSTGVMEYIDFNFTLTATDLTGTFTASASGLAAPDDSAHFSIRQEVGACGMVEIASAIVVNSTTEPATYFEPITLPEGFYEVVVSAEGEVTQVWNIEVAADTETAIDVYFPTTSVAGKVLDVALDELGGAKINAQVSDSGAADPKDEIKGIAETESDEDGAYFMYLPTNESSLNIVATLESYTPECQVVAEMTSNFVFFTLNVPENGTGTFSGSVTGLPAPTDSALFSIRQTHAACGMIEVASASVLNTMPADPLELIYFEPITLPAGEYKVVVSASPEGVSTQVLDIVVVESPAETLLDVDFTPPPTP